MLNIKFKWRNSEVRKVTTLNLIRTTKNLTKNTEVRKAMIQNLTKIMKNLTKETKWFMKLNSERMTETIMVTQLKTTTHKLRS